ncbi:MAG: hypothetical protein KGL02_10685, partial [Acidobacteriota bacterium]|nr:hypothetical protein [Acidobacteriota bacterium]
QLAAAIALAWLASSSGAWGSGFAYIIYSGFLWMSEPGIYTLLMNNVGEGERAGAASLNLLVVSGAQAVAAMAAGAAFTRFGYPVAMAAISVTMFAAACLFRFVVTPGGPEIATDIQHAPGSEFPGCISDERMMDSPARNPFQAVKRSLDRRKAT